MTIDDVAVRVSEVLNAASIPYMLVGGFSSNVHGIPHSTKDADFVVQFDVPLGGGFAALLGAGFEAEPQMSFETNTGTQRQEFRVSGTLFKVEVFRLSSDPHDQELPPASAHRIPGAPDFFPYRRGRDHLETALEAIQR